jgi:hypothetical protein
MTPIVVRYLLMGTVEEKKEKKPKESARCPDCAFQNPSGAVFCGMCGNRLPARKLDLKDAKSSYTNSVIGGQLQDAYNYGYNIWGRGLFLFIGLSILVIILGVLIVPITIAFGPRVYIPANILFLAFLWTASSRIYLDAIRERPVSLARAIGAGFLGMFPALWPLAWIGLALLLLFGFHSLWMIPERALNSFELLKESPVTDLFVFLWRAALYLIVMVPASIWIMIFGVLAVCRIVDRRGSIWLAPVWALRQLWKRLWRFLGIGLAQIAAQGIGLIVCYVGILASLPLSGISLAAIYEWVRLHGDSADEF